MNTEVVRMLSYMAAFASPVHRESVAVLMDKLAQSQTIGAVVTANRSEHYATPYPTAQLAAEAVKYAEEGGVKPEWIRQAGIED